MKLQVTNTHQNLFGHTEITGAEDENNPGYFTSPGPRCGRPEAPARRGTAAPPTGFAFEAPALHSQILAALLRCVADLFLLIF